MFLKNFILENSKLLVFALFALKDQKNPENNEKSNIEFQQFLDWRNLAEFLEATIALKA